MLPKANRGSDLIFGGLLRCLSVVVVVAILLGSAVGEAATARSLINILNSRRNQLDALSKRIILKDIAKLKVTRKEWYEVRTYLLNNPQMGYDLIYKWERVRPEDKIDKKEESFNEKIDEADSLMLAEKFEESFAIFQNLALQVKKEIRKGRRENWYLYNSLLHSMARALYGAKRFDESLEVYRWISMDYPRLRQTLFEKMWAGFRAGRLDHALGAIASQQSTYFSHYLEPETYLVKIYIFKKLCRENDVKGLRREIEILRDRITKDSKNRFYEEWAQADIEYRSLYNLTRLPISVQEQEPVSTARRKKEQTQIDGSLKRRYTREKIRLKEQFEKVLAYSDIAIGTKDFSFLSHQKLDREELMARGDEIWPVEDAEDWVDEMGGHLFIGESRCKK